MNDQREPRLTWSQNEDDPYSWTAPGGFYVDGYQGRRFSYAMTGPGDEDKWWWWCYRTRSGYALTLLEAQLAAERAERAEQQRNSLWTWTARCTGTVVGLAGADSETRRRAVHRLAWLEMHVEPLLEQEQRSCWLDAVSAARRLIGDPLPEDRVGLRRHLDLLIQVKWGEGHSPMETARKDDWEDM